MQQTRSSPLLLSRRNLAPPGGAAISAALSLPLSAEQRTRLRGRRVSGCGLELVLQLPRGEALQPGEWLAGASGEATVRVEAAPERLLLVRSADPLELLRAAYHLGNRHVALQLRPQELRLLADPVLADLLERLGLQLERRLEPFLPEAGAYASGHHQDGHQHGPGDLDHRRHDHGAGTKPPAVANP